MDGQVALSNRNTLKSDLFSNEFFIELIKAHKKATEGLIDAISELESFDLSVETRELVTTMKYHANELYKQFDVIEL